MDPHNSPTQPLPPEGDRPSATPAPSAPEPSFRPQGILARFLPQEMRPNPGSVTAPLADFLIGAVIIFPFFLFIGEENISYGLVLLVSFILTMHWVIIGFKRFSRRKEPDKESPATRFAIAFSLGLFPATLLGCIFHGFPISYHDYWAALHFPAFAVIFPLLAAFLLGRSLENGSNQIIPWILIAPSAFVAPATLPLAAAVMASKKSTAQGLKTGLVLTTLAWLLAAILEPLGLNAFYISGYVSGLLGINLG